MKKRIKNYIIKLIFHLPPQMKRFCLAWLEGMDVWVHGGGKMGDAISGAFVRFLDENQQSDVAYKRRLTRDIMKCYVHYDILPNEYFYFGFEEKGWSLRDTYLTDAQEDELLIKTTGYDAYLKDLSDKYNFYRLARPYFHRKVMLFDEKSDIKSLASFCGGLGEVFVKPLTGSEGDGAFIADVSSTDAVITLHSKLTGKSVKWMIEERIHQSMQMSLWNPTSVNTVRLPTFLNDAGFFVLAPIFRTGRIGSAVDNTSAGGIFALVDAVSGALVSNGFDIYNHEYMEHPDAKIAFLNYQIPRWKELVETAERLHRTFPSHRYVAWDFALTDNGWELIEGNWGRFRGAQIAGKKGLGKEFQRLMNGQTPN